MDTASIHTWVDILKNVAELLVVVTAAAAAYGILLLSKNPRVYPEILVHWPGGTLSNNSVLSLQIRFSIPAAGSQVVMEIEPERLIFEQPEHRTSFSPYAFLKPLALGTATEFVAKVREFSHPIIIIGCNQEVQHIAFIPDKNNNFLLMEGHVKILLRVRYVVHNPLFRIVTKPRTKFLEIEFSREVTADEASSATVEKWGWLGRDLQAT